jgi:hypothetical protein
MLILEIALGIILALVLWNVGIALIVWVVEWETGTKVIVALVFVILLIVAHNEMFPDKKASSVSTPDEPIHVVLESRASFAARYKKANPETANIPDEQLVEKVLQQYPEWCPKVQGGCP